MNSFQIVNLPLETRVVKPQVVHFEALDSTNAYLLGRHPHPSGTVVWADFQSAGRGRLGRSWVAPRDEALLFSIYLNMPAADSPLFVYPFLSAVGVLEAMKTFVSPAWLALKWPNDVLLKNKKICGILVQSKTRQTKNTVIVIGIGLNINQKAEFFQPDLPFAGSLYSITGKKYERLSVLARLIGALDQNLVKLQNSGPAAILQKWREYCPYFGQEIKVSDGRQVYSGLFSEITETGGLILKSGREKRIFHAGDVTILKEL